MRLHSHMRPLVPLALERPIVGIVGSLCRGFMLRGCGSLRVHGLERLLAVARDRPKHQPLITVINHHSMLDDPLLWGVLPSDLLWDSRRMRVAIAAEEIIFTNPVFDVFFTVGRTIPVRRGDGIYQRGMNAAIEELNKGGWINIYPEGKINTTPECILPFRWGVGHLMMHCKNPPIVLPIYHEGMDAVLPLHKKIPNFGKSVDIAFGPPKHYGETMQELRNSPLSDPEKRSLLSAMTRDQMISLRDIARKAWGKPPASIPDPPPFQCQ